MPRHPRRTRAAWVALEEHCHRGGCCSLMWVTNRTGPSEHSCSVGEQLYADYLALDGDRVAHVDRPRKQRPEEVAIAADVDDTSEPEMSE